jgi:hypothetical protein
VDRSTKSLDDLVNKRKNNASNLLQTSIAGSLQRPCCAPQQCEVECSLDHLCNAISNTLFDECNINTEHGRLKNSQRILMQTWHLHRRLSKAKKSVIKNNEHSQIA